MAINWGQISNVIEKEAIGPIGQNHTVTLQQTGAAFDAMEPQDGQGATTDFTVKAVVVPYRRTNRQQNQVNIERGEIKVIISGDGGGVLTEDPRVGWLVTVDSVTYSVLEVNTVRPGTDAVVHVLVCGR